MKSAVVFLADGFEEIEAITAIDVMRRAGIKVDTVSVGKKEVLGAHGIAVTADKTVNECVLSDYCALVLPGGMTGAKTLGETEYVLSAVKKFIDNHKTVAAICAAPATVLGKNGFAAYKRVTCYPAADFINALKGAEYTAESVTVDGNFITANGPKAAFDFALAICKKLEVEPSF